MYARVAKEPGMVSALCASRTIRQGRLSRSGVERSERAVRAKTWGNLLQGTLPSKGARRRTDSLEGKMTETQSSQDVSTKLERIATLAKVKPGVRLLTLAHHIDVGWLGAVVNHLPDRNGGRGPGV
jgi:hypothetical protein